jgi:hypothetical protein
MTTLKEQLETAYEKGLMVGWENCMLQMNKYLDERKAQLKQFKIDAEYESKKKSGVFKKVK